MENNENIYGFRKYVPGQLWFMDINTEALTGVSFEEDDNDKLYLIIAANNRRLIVLRCTLHGEYASNWIYNIEISKKGPSRIILDAPITVETRTVRGSKNFGSFSHALYKDILKKFIACMISLSIEDLLESEKSIVDINRLIGEHEDRFLSFAKYSITYENDEESEDVNVNDESMDISDSDNVENPVKEKSVEPRGSVIEHEEPKSECKSKEESSKVIDISDKSNKPTNGKINQTIGRRGNITAEDVFIFSKGRTTREECIKELERIGFTNGAFVMNDLMNRGKVVYLNNRYNVTRKHSLLNPKSGEKVAIKNYINDILTDVNEMGISNTAKIWGRTYTAIHKAYSDSLKIDIHTKEA